jgi:hypothetical protein
MEWVTRVRGTRLALCAGVLVALSACGGGGGDGVETPTGGGGTAAPTVDYLPLATGNQWHYALEEDDSVSYVMRVGERREVPGVGTGMLILQESGESTYREIYVASSTGLTLHAAESDANAKAFDGTSLLRLPARVGETRVLVDRTVEDDDLDADGRKDALSVHAESTVVGIEAVETPAGRFTDTLRQRVVSRYRTTYTSGKPADEYTVTSDVWYAPAIGVVRSAGSLVQNGQTYTSNWLLRDYAVGTLRSDTTAPTLQGVSPAAGPLRPAEAIVSATFSEAVDPRSVTSSTFTVTGAGGVPVAGTLSFRGFQVSFEPLVPWASGTYTATLKTGVTDRLGNPLAAARTWQFTVDAQGPTLVRTVPPQNGGGVAVGATLELEFSEAPSGYSLDGVRLRNASGQGVPVNVRSDGNKVFVQPQVDLAPGTSYTLRVEYIIDVLGNMMPAFELRFTTTLGTFKAPVNYLGGRQVTVTEIADVGGDTRPEIISLGSVSSILPSDSTVLYVGPAAGPQVPVDLAWPGGATCRLTSVATGDLNDDGLTDIAVGSSSCGLRVLLQRPGGGFDLGALMAGPDTEWVRIADIDGNGRLALIGASQAAGKVSIWRRDGAGVWRVPQRLDTGTLLVRDLVVADLTGDGRLDIATVTDFGDTIEVLAQPAVGTFAAAVRYSVPGGFARSLAAGDLDGDGRPDLVVARDGQMMLFQQQADGSLAAGRPLFGSSSATALRLADLNGDGRQDVVAVLPMSGEIQILLQRPDGSVSGQGWYSGATTASGFPLGFAIGDLDGDGRLDLAAGGQYVLQEPAPSATPMRTLRLRAR